MNDRVYIQAVGDVNKSILMRLKKNLTWRFKPFNLKFSIISEKLSLFPKDYDPMRNQYNASKILNKLQIVAKEKMYFRLLGVLDVDIYSGILNFIFGIANTPKLHTFKDTLPALISITRLRETFYKREPNEALFELRILKEAVHELGHTFGLMHHEGECIMRFANSLMEVDIRPLDFCNSCVEKIKEFLSRLDF